MSKVICSRAINRKRRNSEVLILIECAMKFPRAKKIDIAGNTRSGNKTKAESRSLRPGELRQILKVCGISNQRTNKTPAYLKIQDAQKANPISKRKEILSAEERLQKEKNKAVQRLIKAEHEKATKLMQTA